MMTAVGVLGVSGRVEAQAPFLEGMREHGYVQGQNLTFQRADRVIE
jgi:hypothetical protein